MFFGLLYFTCESLGICIVSLVVNAFWQAGILFRKNKTDHSFYGLFRKGTVDAYSIDKLETIHSVWPASVNSPKPAGSSM